tara:strand:- start:4504 stop:4968 length:465 start_codon:yes stop_codon:yes gene_type:complete
MASKAGVGIPKKKQEVSIPKMPDKKSNKEEVGIPKMPKKRSDKQEKPKKRKGRRPLPCPVGKKRNAQGKCVIAKEALPPKDKGKGKASICGPGQRFDKAKGKCVKSKSGNKSPKKGVRKPNKKPNAACMAKANGMIRRGQAMKRRCKSRPTIQK